MTQAERKKQLEVQFSKEAGMSASKLQIWLIRKRVTKILEKEYGSRTRK